MSVPRVNLYKYHRSFDKTNKVKRTITKQKPYIQNKVNVSTAYDEQEILVSLNRQKQIYEDWLEKLKEIIENNKVNEIQYYALLLYGIKLDKETIVRKLKARKAK